MAHRLIEAAREAKRMAGRGIHFCTDCMEETLVNDDYRCVACGSGRTVTTLPHSGEKQEED